MYRLKSNIISVFCMMMLILLANTSNAQNKKELEQRKKKLQKDLSPDFDNKFWKRFDQEYPKPKFLFADMFKIKINIHTVKVFIFEFRIEIPS